MRYWIVIPLKAKQWLTGSSWKEEIGLNPPNLVVFSEFPTKTQEYSVIPAQGCQLSALLYNSAEEIADFSNIYNVYDTSHLHIA